MNRIDEADEIEDGKQSNLINNNSIVSETNSLILEQVFVFEF